MVASTPPTQPTGETLPEIAARHGRALNTLKTVWTRHPDWPAPIGKHGRYNVYDPTAVDAVITEHFARPQVELEPDRLYTARELGEALGISHLTINADVKRGRIPPADDTTQRAHRWYGRTVMTAVNARHRSGKAPQ